MRQRKPKATKSRSAKCARQVRGLLIYAPTSVARRWRWDLAVGGPRRSVERLVIIRRGMLLQ